MSIPRPTPTAAIKLASLAVHVEELIEGSGIHVSKEGVFDLQAIRGLLVDAEVKAYLAELEPLALLPVKRGGGAK